MVLGFQGKAQVEALYGHVSEAMLSQPATKIFLKTSEPGASEWISKAIGEIEIERFRESRNRTESFLRTQESSEFKETSRGSHSSWRLEVGGLDPLHGYMKHGNLVLPMRFPYLNLQSNVAKFVERKLSPPMPPTTSPKPEVVGSGGTEEEAIEGGSLKRSRRPL